MGSCCVADHSDDYTKIASSAPWRDIGLAVGGAKDVNNFRQCIEANVMPSNGSITYNGLLYEYYFDTSAKKSTPEMKQNSDNYLFHPTYCYAKTKKLELMDQKATTDTKCDDEYYLTVGLNSNIKQDQFKRKHLNLVIALDTSSSMTFIFDKTNAIDDNVVHNLGEHELINWMETLKIGDKLGYNNSNNGGNHWFLVKIIDINDDKNEFKIHIIGFDAKYDRYIQKNHQYLAPLHALNTKLKVAEEAIISLCQHLTSKDRVGLVVFNKNAAILHNLEPVDDSNMDTLKSQLLAVNTRTGTNLEDGYNKAISLYDELRQNADLKQDEEEEYENRIIFLTDAQINCGNIDTQRLLHRVSKYATDKSHIYSTFIGIGLDFNSNVIEELSNTRGCNYYCIKTIDQFKKTMDKQEFEYMVTPLVFDVCLRLICEGDSCVIDTVYGASDEMKQNIKNNGEIVNIHTLFPSKRCASRNETKGGIQLIKLRKISNNEDAINCEIEVRFEDRNGKIYTNKQFITFDTEDNHDGNFYDNKGIRKAILLCKYGEILIEWIKMRNSKSISNGSDTQTIIIDNAYRKKLEIFLAHFETEMQYLDDNTLQKEVDIIKKLINQSGNA